MAHFQIPLNLPHAGTVARRIHRLLPSRLPAGDAADETLKSAKILEVMLAPYEATGENPPKEEAYLIRDEAAVRARRLVDDIEKLKAGEDRLGQCIRNLFECLELGEEGAAISLRAGENPNSLQRPI